MASRQKTRGVISLGAKALAYYPFLAPSGASPRPKGANTAPLTMKTKKHRLEKVKAQCWKHWALYDVIKISTPTALTFE